MDNTHGRIRSFIHFRAALWRRALPLGSVLLPAAVLAANIVGTSGPDVLEGTVEADHIDGKEGADVMMGLFGNDTFVVDQADDEVLEAAGDGTDTVVSTATYTLPIHVENLSLVGGSLAINGTGNGLDNRLRGNAGPNVLNGRAGTDTMFGSGGDDTFVVDRLADVVNEAAGAGLDTVRSSVSYTLPLNVENLVLTGTAANGTGNTLANTVTGNPANNRLTGLAGNDWLRGLGGNDRLIGGPGNDKITTGNGRDTIDFDTAPDAATNLDQVVDFNPAADVMRLIGAAFPTLPTAGTLSPDLFRNGVTAATAAHRILYDAGTGVLRYDADGSGPIASVRFARLVNLPVLTSASFTVVNPVVTAADYDQVQQIFTSRCIGCHNGSSAPHGLILAEGQSYDLLVNIASKEVPSLKRVEPGDPDDSYLVQKVEGTAAVGGRMPLNSTPLTDAQIALIRSWISAGANP
jgi:Ca2+-binding RTX toxin-like protein